MNANDDDMPQWYVNNFKQNLLYFLIVSPAVYAQNVICYEITQIINMYLLQSDIVVFTKATQKPRILFEAMEFDNYVCCFIQKYCIFLITRKLIFSRHFSSRKKNFDNTCFLNTVFCIWIFIRISAKYTNILLTNIYTNVIKICFFFH